MLFTTSTQFVVLGLVLVAGWLLGLASHPGGRKWKTRYAAEREAHAAARREADTRIADADRRIAEAERARAAPVVTESRTAGDHRVDADRYPASDRIAAGERVGSFRPVAASAARPAYPVNGERRGWFDWGRPAVR